MFTEWIVANVLFGYKTVQASAACEELIRHGAAALPRAKTAPCRSVVMRVRTIAAIGLHPPGIAVFPDDDIAGDGCLRMEGKRVNDRDVFFELADHSMNVIDQLPISSRCESRFL